MTDEPDDLPSEERARSLGRASSRPVGLDEFPDKHSGLTGPPRAQALNSSPKGQKAKSAKAAVKPVEVSVVGNFANPYGSVADEVKAMSGSGTWSPSTDDFLAVAGNAMTVDDYLGTERALAAAGGGGVE